MESNAKTFLLVTDTIILWRFLITEISRFLQGKYVSDYLDEIPFGKESNANTDITATNIAAAFINFTLAVFAMMRNVVKFSPFQDGEKFAKK